MGKTHKKGDILVLLSDCVVQYLATTAWDHHVSSTFSQYVAFSLVIIIISSRLPESSSSFSPSLSFFPSFASFCSVRTEGSRSKRFHCLLISQTAHPRAFFFSPRGWLNEDVKCWIFFFLCVRKRNLVPAAVAPCTQLLKALQQPQVCSQELLNDPKYSFSAFFPT